MGQGGTPFYSETWGGGMYVEASSITVRNTVFTANTARWGGAFVFWSSPSSVMENVQVIDNDGLVSVIEIGESNVSIANSKISNNRASLTVLYFRASGVVLDNVAIENHTDQSSQLLSIRSNDGFDGNPDFPVIIRNSVIRNNNVSARTLEAIMGGQLIIEKSELSNNTGNLIYYGWAKLKIIGSTVVNNTNSSEFLNSVITNSSLDDGYYLGDITIANTIVWGNSDPSGIPPITLPGIHPYNNLPYTPIHIDYSLIQGGWPDTSSVGILDTDPLFVDFLNGDYHLTSSSPAIDSGDPNSPLDPDGSRADMGAYPFFHTLTPTETVNDLIDKVEIFNFQQGISSSLDAKLNAALNALDDLNENNDQAPQ